MYCIYIYIYKIQLIIYANSNICFLPPQFIISLLYSTSPLPPNAYTSDQHCTRLSIVVSEVSLYSIACRSCSQGRQGFSAAQLSHACCVEKSRAKEPCAVNSGSNGLHVLAMVFVSRDGGGFDGGGGFF